MNMAEFVILPLKNVLLVGRDIEILFFDITEISLSHDFLRINTHGLREGSSQVQIKISCQYLKYELLVEIIRISTKVVSASKNE